MVSTARILLIGWLIAFTVILTILWPVVMVIVFAIVWVIGIPYWCGYFDGIDLDNGPGGIVWPVVLVIWGFFKVVRWTYNLGRRRSSK